MSWLRELVEVEVPLKELGQRLTMAGLEVEEIVQVGSDWRNVTIGRVVELQKHARREGLFVARVDLGAETSTVVTGAQNLQVGDIVAHVAPGGAIPAGEVGRRDFGGVHSEGMVLSGDELRISPDRDGIYVLEPDAPIGVPLAEFLNEAVLDIYISANRPDCMSIVGVAREIHALFGAPYTAAMLRLLDPSTAQVDGSSAAPPVSDLLWVQIEDPVGCPRFTASVVQDITISGSPRWMQRRLYFAGVRPISNVVDITNYVMLELGQPLHAFDRQRLQSKTIVVRRARVNEPLRTLDGEQRTLSPEMLVVTDGQRPRSLAGIMGGEDSEITEATSDVVFEGASWDRASIRRASAGLGLSSEASRRFGRGVDPDLTALGVARATALTLELGGGKAARGLIDDYPGRESPRIINLRPAQIDELIGRHYPRPQVVETLTSLGFLLQESGEELRVAVPGWRRFDIEGRADLAEEVGRIAGFDLVPTTMLHGALPTPRPDGDAGFADELRARKTLAAAGLQEVITYSLTDPVTASEPALEPSTETDQPIRVTNPQSVELSVLRSSLLGGLLIALRSNLRQRERVLIYELARTWHGDLHPLPDERRHIGVAIVGPRDPRGWSTRNDRLDFYDIKGVIDALAESLNIALSYAPGKHPVLHPGRTAQISIAGQLLGVIGQLHPTTAARYDLDGANSDIYVAELDFEKLLSARQPLLTVQTPSRFPPSDRDISFFIDEATPHRDVEQAIRSAAGSLLESVNLFDLYTGQSIPAGRKSLAFALRYRAPDRTLDDDEVSAVHDRVERDLRDRFGAEIRGR